MEIHGLVSDPKRSRTRLEALVCPLPEKEVTSNEAEEGADLASGPSRSARRPKETSCSWSSQAPEPLRYRPRPGYRERGEAGERTMAAATTVLLMRRRQVSLHRSGRRNQMTLGLKDPCPSACRYTWVFKVLLTSSRNWSWMGTLPDLEGSSRLLVASHLRARYQPTSTHLQPSTNSVSPSG